MVTINNIMFLVVFLKTMPAESGLVIPIQNPLLRYFNDNKHTGKDLEESGEIGGILEQQIPDDIIYDLAGRMKLITRNEITDEYSTFMVNRDKDGIPYINDPETGHKYVVKHSRIRKGVDIYKIVQDETGTDLVTDWATMTLNRIKLNKYREIELEPINRKNETIEQ